MGENSGIEWTHHTFNPWWGCVKVSPGCAHCYAETFSKRYGHNIWGPASTTTRRTFGDKHWNEPVKWNRAAEAAGEQRRVFCASMADVYEDHPATVGERSRLWELIERTTNLDWLLLTKRPENVIAMTPAAVLDMPNIWIGTSVENQEQADKRIPILIDIPVRTRFLSVEPLLGPVDLSNFLDGNILSPIDWCIVGGESGPGARPMQAEWVRSLRDQCVTACVSFHFKQWGGVNKKKTGRVLDGRTWDEYPVTREVKP